MTDKEDKVAEQIDPKLAVAMAKAAGLDASSLEEQVRRQEAGDDDPDRLRARIAELEAQVTLPPTERSAAQQQAEGEEFVQELRDALSKNRVSLPGLLDQ
jgi:BMFP domain-containing protein YqiC